MEDEPASAEEILKMALHLGMDPANDEALLWIAAEAYDAPLPDPWTEHFDWEGRVYFYNANTDAVTRDHPLDDFYRELYKAYKNHGAVAASKLGDAQMRAVAAAAAAANAAATANTICASRSFPSYTSICSINRHNAQLTFLISAPNGMSEVAL